MSFLDVLYFIVPSAIFYAAPLVFTAIGGVFSERSGVINIGLEGMMVMGAFISIIFNLTFVSTFGAMTPWVAVIAAMIVSGIFALLHAVASVSFRADQTISGVAINMLGVAIALFTVKMIYDKGQTDYIQERFIRFDIPGLSEIPIIGPMLFKDVYSTSILAVAVAILA